MSIKKKYRWPLYSMSYFMIFNIGFSFVLEKPVVIFFN